jgi:hypothetical protein
MLQYLTTKDLRLLGWSWMRRAMRVIGMPRFLRIMLSIDIVS